MSRVLVIESSARQRGSVSRLLTAEFISHWKAAHPADRFRSATWRASRCRTSMNYCWEPGPLPAMAIALRKGAPSSVPIA